MIYLKEETTAFLKALLLEAEQQEHKYFYLDEDKNEALSIEIISKTDYQTIFTINITNDFSLSICYQKGKMFPFCYSDNLNLPHFPLFSISVLDLLKNQKFVVANHFLLMHCVEAITQSLNIYFEYPNLYTKELQKDSFNIIQQIFSLLIVDTRIVANWNITNVIFNYKTVLLSIESKDYQGNIKITHNQTTNKFEVYFLKNNLIKGCITGIEVNNLVDSINKKINFVEIKKIQY